MVFVPVPITAGTFFISSWLTMIFWGIISPDLGIPTIGYSRALLVTLALWLVVAPLVIALRRRGGGGQMQGWSWRRQP